jgi:hypothetical protein
MSDGKTKTVTFKLEVTEEQNQLIEDFLSKDRERNGKTLWKNSVLKTIFEKGFEDWVHFKDVWEYSRKQLGRKVGEKFGEYSKKKPLKGSFFSSSSLSELEKLDNTH